MRYSIVYCRPVPKLASGASRPIAQRHSRSLIEYCAKSRNLCRAVQSSEVLSEEESNLLHTFWQARGVIDVDQRLKLIAHGCEGDTGKRLFSRMTLFWLIQAVVDMSS